TAALEDTPKTRTTAGSAATSSYEDLAKSVTGPHGLFHCGVCSTLACQPDRLRQPPWRDFLVLQQCCRPGCDLGRRPKKDGCGPLPPAGLQPHHDDADRGCDEPLGFDQRG